MGENGDTELRPVGGTLKGTDINDKLVVNVPDTASDDEVGHRDSSVDEGETGGINRGDQRGTIVLKNLNIDVNLRALIGLEKHDALENSLNDARGSNAASVTLPRSLATGGGEKSGGELTLDDRAISSTAASGLFSRAVHCSEHTSVSLLKVRGTIRAGQGAHGTADLANLTSASPINAQPRPTR